MEDGQNILRGGDTMADASYDAIVVGGGHHGLIVACYLQKAGLKTAIFERRSKLGGAVTTESGPAPGFLMNPCSNWSRFYSHPAYRDFNLGEKGMKYVFPDQSAAMVFDNDTCLVCYSAFKVVDHVTGKAAYSEENMQKSLKEIARFSERDAETAQELLRRYLAKWQTAFNKYRMSPPTPWGEKNELEKLCDDPKDGIDPVYQFMTCQQVAYDLFESDELRTFFMRGAMTSTGIAPQDVLGIYWFLHTIGLVLSWSPPAISVGGNGVISDALQAAFTEMGGQFFVNSEVTKLIIKRDRAKGIRLKNGSEVEAKQVVVSDLSAYQTVCQLIGEDYVRPEIIRRIKNIKYDRHNIIWATYAVHELPKYKAACFNSDCGLQPRLYTGPRNAEYLANKYYAETLLNGIAKRLLLFIGTDTMWDKTRAPEDKHILGIEEFTAPVRFFSPSQWEQLRIDFEEAIIREWQIYAPNMIKENVIACHVNTPYDIANEHTNLHEGCVDAGDMIVSQLDRFRPIPEMYDYRTPIKNFYICSAATHSGGGTGRGSSYCCYQTIAGDLGLKGTGK
jgi:beta-carotene ketolase (CrtO type)